MIESITLTDFQKHSSKTLLLESGANCLTGQSKSGKSACLRALIWALTNDPDGLEFVGKWGTAKYSAVKVKLDGHSIVRKKGKTHNSYSLDGDILVSFGRGGVPKPIEDLANVGEINFQGQHDPPFWLTLSPPEVSRRLNSIINLGLIDSSLNAAASEVRLAKTTVNLSKERLNTATERLNSTEWVERLDRFVTAAEQTQTAIETLQATAENRTVLASGIVQATQTLARASRAVLRSSGAIKLWQEFIALAEKRDKIVSICAGINRLNERVQRPIPDISKLTVLVERTEIYELKKRKVETLVNGILGLKHSIQLAQMEVESTEKMIRKMNNGRCPTCGQLIKEKARVR